MNEQAYREIARLADMKANAFRQRYAEVFGEQSNSGNAAYLRKRIAWRIQSPGWACRPLNWLARLTCVRERRLE
ncbi:MAG: DUF2924 domain-containing protein [Desulfovibrio sp.]|nr:DUF2924 domain-containing protein [Desulfovibrio sp.]